MAGDPQKRQWHGRSPWWWVENGRVYFEESAPISPEAWAARDVPNRLYGATVNHEGEAV